MSAVHRVRLPAGAVVLVEVGHTVEPAETIATRRAAHGGASLPIAARLRRPPPAGAPDAPRSCHALHLALEGISPTRDDGASVVDATGQ